MSRHSHFAPQYHKVLELQEFMYAGGDVGEKSVSNGPTKTKKKDEHYPSPFGSGDVITVTAMIAQMWLLITSFFTDSINAAILTEYTGEEVLGIMFLSVFLWFSLAPTLRRIAVTVPAEGIGWKKVWVMAVDFLSRIILLVAFGYAAILLKTMWVRSGLVLVEILFVTAVLALYGFGFYAVALMWTQMEARIKRDSERVSTEDYNPAAYI